MESLAPILAGVLLLGRLLPVVELMPVLSDPWVPRTVRFAIALGLAALLGPLVVPPSLVVHTPGVLEFVGMLVRELAVGLVIGFVGSLVFEGARMAGAILDRVGGLSAGEQEGPLGRLYVLVAAALFFVLGGPRLWLFALAESYTVVGLGTGMPTMGGLEVARATADVLALAVLLALPVLATLLLAELLHAVAARFSRVVEDGAGPASTRTLVIVAAVALGIGVFGAEIGTATLAAMDALPDAMRGLDVR